MPQIGEIKRGRGLGKSQTTGQFIWSACSDCGQERWVQLVSIKIGKRLKNIFCLQCSHKRKQPRAELSKSWKGGKYKSADGYVMIRVQPEDFFSPMAHDRYCFEHRLIMARSLGRCLQKFEVVHHKNGVKHDNRLENLELSTYSKHTLQHSKGYRDGYNIGYYDGKNQRAKDLESRVTLLEAELELLKVERQQDRIFL